MTPSSEPIDGGAVILAGGESRRMGQNKCLLPYQGVPLIQHMVHQLRPLFTAIQVSTNTPEQYAFLDLPMLGDTTPGCGPLGGLAAALDQCEDDWTFIIAGDIPRISPTLVRQLHAQREGYECVLPKTASGRYQPLFAFYHRALRGRLAQQLDSGSYRVHDFLSLCSLCTVAIPDDVIDMMNTPEEYERLKKQ